MAAPQERIMVGSCDVLLVGTIPGFIPDGDVVRVAAAEHQADAIALGVPPEDIESLQVLAADPSLADGLEPDELDAHMLDVLGHWGETQSVPSPDLEAAAQSGLVLHGVDLDDSAHTERFTELVKVRHLVQRQSARKKARKLTPDDAPGPHALAKAWDAALRTVVPLDTLEKEREAAMSERIEALAGSMDRLVAVVHVARFDGVCQRLRKATQP